MEEYNTIILYVPNNDYVIRNIIYPNYTVNRGSGLIYNISGYDDFSSPPDLENEEESLPELINVNDY